ncbi:MAG: restriction endonuclease subunit R [Deltaproteobacteria bacterium]|nr:MAG: restriction endonuclease subunit R [Deltaproteobacteria bacterium]
MKLHFEDNLDFQQKAVESVAELFSGQDICRTEFTVSKLVGQQALPGQEESTLGIGNRLQLLDDKIHENLQAIQLRNGLRPSDSLASGDFTIEMETGTGKTYVYLRTIFELNKRYGFTKFMIVVPSVAIKEGTYKTLQITRDHFENLYPMAKGYEYFLYDSGKLGQVRNYATSPNIQIMIVTVGAINKKDVNNLYKDSEKTGGEKPIDLVKASHPIIIVDEPQSVDGGLTGKGKKAIDDMNPLCTLRYSATHADKHHKLYRLDAVDAYERELVKQIEVASLEVKGGHNRAYLKLISTHNKSGSVTAKVEADIQGKTKIIRKKTTVKHGDDLEQVTGRSIYEDFRIGTITCGKANESMEISMPGGEQTLRPGNEVGSVSPDDVKRLMIRRTVKEHLDKEIRFAEQKRGIKVLSLFFIDSVEFYRSYDENGNEVKGKYALMFEEEYRKLAKQPEYQTLFVRIDLSIDASEVHNGYFSIDKKGGWKDPSRNKKGKISDNATNRENTGRAYNLIMKEKEKLLSFDSKLKFIFSHSALKEGWDNPNVFQICALRDMSSERERRQTIGRGLRLCVNQEGKRLKGFDVNTLTVVARESYKDFAENLQKEIEKDTGIRFGIVEKHQFATIPVIGKNGETEPLGVKESEKIWGFLKDKGYLDKKGKVQDSLRTAIKENTLELPEEYANHAPEIKAVLRKLAGKLDIKNADERIPVRTREAVLESEGFRALWDRIRHKTTYRIEFDNAELLRDCSQAILDGPPVTKTRAQFRKADIAIGKGGVNATETAASGFTSINETDIELPDLLTDLQDKTQLTRRSLVKILTKCRRLNDFRINPQEFIEIASEAVNRTKRLALVDGIRYQRIGDDHCYAQELFEKEELTGYLKNTLETQKSVYQHVIYDSAGIEKRFAQDLEANEAVKVYAKLPGWFKVPTPLGTYNPDWAVLVETNGEEKLYFVVETKGSNWWDDLRQKEAAKIKCGEKHFAALEHGENPAKFIKVVDVADMLKYS